MDIKEDNQDIQMLKEELWVQWTISQDKTPLYYSDKNIYK